MKFLSHSITHIVQQRPRFDICPKVVVIGSVYMFQASYWYMPAVVADFITLTRLVQYSSIYDCKTVKLQIKCDFWF